MCRVEPGGLVESGGHLARLGGTLRAARPTPARAARAPAPGSARRPAGRRSPPAPGGPRCRGPRRARSSPAAGRWCGSGTAGGRTGSRRPGWGRARRAPCGRHGCRAHRAHARHPRSGRRQTVSDREEVEEARRRHCASEGCASRSSQRRVALDAGPAGDPHAPRPRPPGTFKIGSIAGSDVLVSSSWFVVAALIAVVVAPRVEQVQPGPRAVEVRRRGRLRDRALPLGAAPRGVARVDGPALRLPGLLDHPALPRRRHRDRGGGQEAAAGVLDRRGRAAHLARGRAGRAGAVVRDARTGCCGWWSRGWPSATCSSAP